MKHLIFIVKSLPSKAKGMQDHQLGWSTFKVVTKSSSSTPAGKIAKSRQERTKSAHVKIINNLLYPTLST